MDTFGDGLSVGASFGGASGMAILHMVAQLKPNVHVFVLDTDYLFEETYETMRRAVPALGLTNVHSLPLAAVPRGAGRPLRRRALDARPRPLLRNPQGRAQPPRARRQVPHGSAASAATSPKAAPSTPIVSWAEKFGVVKVNPLATWDEKQTWEYLLANNVPYNPLLDQGYASIGCYNCTVPGVQGRAGRWQGIDEG